MIKKTITFSDYNGLTRTEDFYFNLNQAELIEMETSVDGGLKGMMQRIMDKKNIPGMMNVFKEFIIKSYGEKTPDGRGFVKINDNGVPLYRSFVQTEAYSILYVELVTNADAAVEFINGLIADVKTTATPAINMTPGTN